MDKEQTRQQEYQRIADTFHKVGDYKQMYKDYSVVATEVWNDKERKDYESDLWYNLNCNEICLEMLKGLTKDKRILTIGGGFWVEADMLNHITDAKEIIRTDIIPEEGILEMDAADLKFPCNSFDIIICRELIEHVPDEQKVYEEIKRVLVSDGYLLITTPNAFSLAIDGTFHVRGYTPFSFLAELEQHHGFAITQKRGNLPACFHGLKIFSQNGIAQALDEYKSTYEIVKNYNKLYYLGTSLFVLAQKPLVKGEL